MAPRLFGALTRGKLDLRDGIGLRQRELQPVDREMTLRIDEQLTRKLSWRGSKRDPLACRLGLLRTQLDAHLFELKIGRDALERYAQVLGAGAGELDAVALQACASVLQEEDRRVRGERIPRLQVFAPFHARVARKALARLPPEEQSLLRRLELARIEQIAEEPAPRRRYSVGDRDIHYRALRRAFNAHAGRADPLLTIAVQREQLQRL